MAKGGLTPDVAEEAYIWGLPIVAMYRYTVALADRIGGYNQVFHFREFFRPGVLPGGPNRDTLYSPGWLDLVDEPMVISLPEIGDRYFVLQMTDLYATNFKNVGSSLLGVDTEAYSSGYTFALTPPGFKGQIPDDLEVIQSPARLVNLLYRIAAEKTQKDVAAVNELQDQTLILPLSKWEQGSRESVQQPPSKPIPAYREVLSFESGATGKDHRNPHFFSVLADALSIDPPYAPWDKAFVDEKLSALGIVPGRPFELSSLDEEDQALVLDAQERGHDRTLELRKSGYGPNVNGWQFGPSYHGEWGDHYIQRAFAVYMGGMWPKAENSTYAFAYFDGAGHPLTGARRYRLRFESGRLPPATKFWSVTVYETGTSDLYPNADERYSVGSNDPGIAYGQDGSLEIIFAHERPSDLVVANWLPVPQDEFWLAIRFYAPTRDVLDVKYRTPGLEIIE